MTITAEEAFGPPRVQQTKIAFVSQIKRLSYEVDTVLSAGPEFAFNYGQRGRAVPLENIAAIEAAVVVEMVVD